MTMKIKLLKFSPILLKSCFIEEVKTKIPFCYLDFNIIPVNYKKKNGLIINIHPVTKFHKISRVIGHFGPWTFRTRHFGPDFGTLRTIFRDISDQIFGHFGPCVGHLGSCVRHFGPLFWTFRTRINIFYMLCINYSIN
jgi:hypothetical protein